MMKEDYNVYWKYIEHHLDVSRMLTLWLVNSWFFTKKLNELHKQQKNYFNTKALLTSYKVAYTITKYKKPLTVAEELFPLVVLYNVHKATF